MNDNWFTILVYGFGLRLVPNPQSHVMNMSWSMAGVGVIFNVFEYLASKIMMENHGKSWKIMVIIIMAIFGHFMVKLYLVTWESDSPATSLEKATVSIPRTFM